MVPNIKNAGALNFGQYSPLRSTTWWPARGRASSPDDFQGTTISLTNPGTVGTMAPRPRLMPGQGAIVATGAIDYPPEYQGASDRDSARAARHRKVMTLTCTYDHRIIQGAESGAFLGRLQALLEGRTGSTKRSSLTCACRTSPCAGRPTAAPRLPGFRDARRRDRQAGRVMQMINAYRVRGHLIADLDPLGTEPSYHPELDPETYGLTIWDLDREFLTGSLGEAIGEGGPKARRHAARDPRDAAPDLLRQDRLRVHEHPGAEQKRWLQQRMEPEANNWPLDRETAAHSAQPAAAGRGVRALPALALRRAEALRARGRRDGAGHSRRNLERAAARACTRW
jgi:2-oxoglutarate decarboxylase